MHAPATSIPATSRLQLTLFLGLLNSLFAIASATGIIWLCADWGTQYLSQYYVHDCATGRMGALGTVGLLPFLTTLPLASWATATHLKFAVPIARCATLTTGTASFLLSSWVFILECLR